MTMETARRVFLSFRYEDVDYANLVAAWSANENNDFQMYNERLTIAVNSQDAEYIKRRLRPKIDRASVLLCIIGSGTYTSDWVNWEISYAKGQKALVGVLLELSNKRPHEITNAGAIFVPYKKDDMAKAIEWAATSNKTAGDWQFNG